MTHLCCPDCRLRFTPAAAAYLGGCPDCGDPLHTSSLQGMVGFRLVTLDAGPPPLPQALAISIPAPDRGGAGP